MILDGLKHSYDRRSRGVVALTAEGIRRLREMGYTAS
jgi:hypothetical protein